MGLEENSYEDPDILPHVTTEHARLRNHEPHSIEVGFLMSGLIDNKELIDLRKKKYCLRNFESLTFLNKLWYAGWKA